jgi:UDPglucose 6-dehydrogenase
MREARRVFADQHAITFAENPLAACEGADAFLIATEWKEFRSPDFDAIKKALKSPLIFGGRNLYDPSLPQALGFKYFAIGRKSGI